MGKGLICGIEACRRYMIGDGMLRALPSALRRAIGRSRSECGRDGGDGGGGEGTGGDGGDDGNGEGGDRFVDGSEERDAGVEDSSHEGAGKDGGRSGTMVSGTVGGMVEDGEGDGEEMSPAD